MENLLGIVLPVVVEIVNKDVQRDDERFLIALLICLIVACIVKWPQISVGNFTDMAQVGGYFLLIFFEAMATFNLYWRNSFLRSKTQDWVGAANASQQG